MNHALTSAVKRVLTKMEEPHPMFVSGVPFVNEDEVQKFCERYVEKVLGLKVIAGSRFGRANICDIDVLAVSADNTPFVIECKWNRINDAAIAQLRRYREALLLNWNRFERVLSDFRGKKTIVEKRTVLVALGYGYKPSALIRRKSIVPLQYVYPETVNFNYDPLKKRPRQAINIAIAAAPTNRAHPPVHKRDLFIDRLTPTLVEAFSSIDCGLRKLDGANEPKYVKDSARYRNAKGYFAEAKISAGLIQWRFGECAKWMADQRWMVQNMHSAHAGDEILQKLLSTYEKVNR